MAIAGQDNNDGTKAIGVAYRCCDNAAVAVLDAQSSVSVVLAVALAAAGFVFLPRYRRTGLFALFIGASVAAVLVAAIRALA
jgi:hypothetical protein